MFWPYQRGPLEFGVKARNLRDHLLRQTYKLQVILKSLAMAKLYIWTFFLLKLKTIIAQNWICNLLLSVKSWFNLLGTTFRLRGKIYIVCVFSHVSGMPWTLAQQAPLSIQFSRQKHWSWLRFPTLGDLPNPGTDWQADSLPLRHLRRTIFFGG